LNRPISVSELNNQIKSALETTFISVYLEGEISAVTYHKSGHIYFTVKDESSALKAVMFKGNNRFLKFRLEAGQKIVIYGSISVYVPRGEYQLICSKVEPSGVGELALAYEQLKQKLQKEGLFDHGSKKTLPKYPKHIVIVTSNSGAAIEDMKKIAAARWPLLKITLVPTLVQGIGSKEDIVKSIKFADTFEADIMIVGRGGGSMEDLWSFNEEIVARAIFDASTPIISAVGHENDFVISDFVADLRASTPSNAIELATADINEMMISIDNFTADLNKTFLHLLEVKQNHLDLLKKMFKQNSIMAKFNLVEDQVKEFKKRFDSIFLQQLNIKKKRLQTLQENFLLNAPEKKDKKGFAQVTKDGKIVTLGELQKDDIFFLETSEIVAKSKIVDIIIGKSDETNF
jgi:exodeoxyribonuclease VII large subunit